MKDDPVTLLREICGHLVCSARLKNSTIGGISLSMREEDHLLSRITALAPQCQPLENLRRHMLSNPEDGGTWSKVGTTSPLFHQLMRAARLCDDEQALDAALAGTIVTLKQRMELKDQP